MTTGPQVWAEYDTDQSGTLSESEPDHRLAFGTAQFFLVISGDFFDSYNSAPVFNEFKYF